MSVQKVASLVLLSLVVALPNAVGAEDGSSRYPLDVTWSRLEVEPGQIISAVFRGLEVEPEALRFWLDEETIPVRFDVVETGGEIDTLSDDLVTAQQFIPILEPRIYEIALGTEDARLSDNQKLTVLPSEPKPASSTRRVAWPAPSSASRRSPGCSRPERPAADRARRWWELFTRHV